MSDTCEPCIRKTQCTVYCSLSVTLAIVLAILILLIFCVILFCRMIHNESSFMFGEYACGNTIHRLEYNVNVKPFVPQYQSSNALYLSILINNLCLYPCDENRDKYVPPNMDYDIIEIRRWWSKHIYAFILYDAQHQITFIYLTSLKSIFLLSDILFRNLQCPKELTSDKNVKIHSGIYNIYCRVSKKLKETLEKKYIPKTKQVVIFGHSLGGALAPICALDLAESYPFLQSQIYVYTFAAPRTGNIHFRQYYNKKVPNTFRIANIMDGCTLLPVSNSNDPYEHVGQSILLDYDNGMKDNHVIQAMSEHLKKIQFQYNK